MKLDREAWLTETAQFILDDIIAPHTALPDNPFKISLGFPSGRVNKILAQCWQYEASAEGYSEIFVSPIEADSLAILGALVHELIHYTDNCRSGHRNHFARVARAVGLEGKLTATSPGPALSAQLQGYIDLLGPIPHARLDPNKSGTPKQGTRLLKVECTNNQCGFNFRASQKQLDKLPTDPQCPACRLGALEIVS